ncbi:uncharacterized protein LOC129956687 [Argiope bruennichi]|uniref:uncharacterized protein LOC129956687 n=1 Tax=Argiope bruennichi TaxID=94029 RepID=UPI002494D1A5|nr:uncharacterized protein LOC129956687 [Argiope bruennichi]
MPRVVEIRTQITGDCPRARHMQKPDGPTEHSHVAHLKLWKYSRVIALIYARFLEQRCRQELHNLQRGRRADEESETGELIPPPVAAEQRHQKQRHCLSETSHVFCENAIEDLEAIAMGGSDVLSETSQLFNDNEIDGIDDCLNDFDDDDLPQSETSQMFYDNPMPLALYYQVGSGFENQPGPSTRGPAFLENVSSENLDNAVIVDETNRRVNQRYNAEEVTFRARIEEEKIPPRLQRTPLVAAVEAVRALFSLLILRCTQNLRPSDLIRFCFMAIGLERPVSTVLMPVSDVTVERIVAPIMRVLQSYKKLKLKDGVNVDVIIIHRDIGAGGNRRIINIETDRLKKRSVLSIPTDKEGLCCAKAILYALAHLENDRAAINSMKDRRRPALLNRARILHNDTGVPLGPCSYSEIRTFEDFLDIQIVVISSESLNKVSYKGRDRERRINLWFHNGHYDVIKSLKGFYGSDNYCESCEKPFMNLEDHRCQFVCPICLRKDCLPGHPQRCSDCDRLCRSSSCFEWHKATSGKRQKSFCDKMYQCRNCGKVVLRRICPMNMHKCGTSRCPSCKQFVNVLEHRCFLEVVSPKMPSDKLIFFDFETDQSSGTHEVNFAVAQYSNGEETIFRGFDGQFVMAWLLEQGIARSVIPNGSKLMSIGHPTLRITLIDSFNFLPMSLSKLPGCFGLSELKKGFFPHLFNKRENQTYIGPIPDITFYSPDTMRDEFLKWHRMQEGVEFDFQKEMLSYCNYVTIGSACMATYRYKHIRKNSVVMVPVHGYINSTNYNPDAIRWLDFIATQENIEIHHALNKQGEKRINGVSVDGFCEETNTIYQFHGCFYHGCPECFEGGTLNSLSGVSMRTLFERTNESTARLRNQGYRVIEEWEHVFKRRSNDDLELHQFILSHELKDRLEPRDAFYGGRTNAVKLFFEGTAKYVDFTSLYPWVNKYCLYPVGHPEVITENFRSIDDYYGIVKCRVLPPRGLHLPVLPVRCNGKLTFPLCRCCAESLNQSSCHHSDEERSIVGTWVTEEVKLAVEKGYLISKIYEVYHFQEKSKCLFQSYIDLFLKIKQESSGYPSDCTTVEERASYIQQYFEKEGVLLNPAEIKKIQGDGEE